jgi:diguanylate cyclase (GGDEF)-like protein
MTVMHRRPWSRSVADEVTAGPDSPTGRRILTEQVRSCDTVYRYGGEELAIIVRDSDLAAAQALAERLRERVAAEFAGGDGPVVTLSAGVAAVPLHAATPEGLLHAADRALYAAKRQGRNRVATLAP